MPTVTMCYFAHARDLAGCQAEQLELPAAADAETIRLALVARHPQLARLLSASRIAHNLDFVVGTVAIAEGDELAVIPPVSGG